MKRGTTSRATTTAIGMTDAESRIPSTMLSVVCDYLAHQPTATSGGDGRGGHNGQVWLVHAWYEWRALKEAHP